MWVAEMQLQKVYCHAIERLRPFFWRLHAVPGVHAIACMHAVPPYASAHSVSRPPRFGES